jgi:hypothetical protein
MMDLTARPPYSRLREGFDAPPGAAWAVYGREDELGSINLLTEERVLAATRLARRGKVFPLDWALELPDPALFGRHGPRHRIIDLDPAGTEDVYDGFYPQASSQWDGLAHIRHPEFGFYQGRRREELTGRPGSRIGIEHWARHGIVGRFVLADVERWRRRAGRPIRQGRTDPVTVEEIDACLDFQRTALAPGDILLLRFGWIAWYATCDADTRRYLASTDLFPSPGLANGEATAAWIWDRGLAAIAADNAALEVQPFDESRADGFLHYRLIPLLGMAIGELFDLDRLAEDCAADGIYEGLLTAAPLNKLGGCGSPANAIAIK